MNCFHCIDVYFTDEVPSYSATSIEALSKKHFPKKIVEGVDYQSFCEKIEFVLFTTSDQDFIAAATYLHKPTVQSYLFMPENAIRIQSNIAIGKFAEGPIALVKSSLEESIENLFARVKEIFPKAEYVISIGTGYSLQQEMKIGDVFISSGVTAIDNYNVSTVGNIACVYISDLLQTIFCLDSKIPSFKVTNDRISNYRICNIISGHDISKDSELCNKKKIIVNSDAVAGDIDGQELMKMQTKGVIKGFIVIKAVMEYIGWQMSEEFNLNKNAWNFTGTMAAVHYVKEKMIPYMCK